MHVQVLHVGAASVAETFSQRCFTASNDISNQVKWRIVGNKLPGWVLPEHPADLGSDCQGQLTLVKFSG